MSSISSIAPIDYESLLKSAMEYCIECDNECDIHSHNPIVSNYTAVQSYYAYQRVLTIILHHNRGNHDIDSIPDVISARANLAIANERWTKVTPCFRKSDKNAWIERSLGRTTDIAAYANKYMNTVDVEKSKRFDKLVTDFKSYLCTWECP